MLYGVRGIVTTFTTLFLALTLTAGSAAADPLFTEWTELLPGLTSGYDPSDANDCKSGKIQCVDSVIREMTKRFDRHAAACDHDAMFGLTYLRTTEEYRRAAVEPGFFADPGFVNHEDAVFARYYFQAYDAWHRGDVAGTPAAWRVALEAADKRQVTANTNILLGLSAHINRDLPYVLWEIGLVGPDGTSRKADHDKVNEFLNRVSFYVEANRRFDPSLPTTEPPGYMAAIQAMREQAWRNAERLRLAENDPVQLALVKESIESFAYTEALSIKASGSYGFLSPNGSSSANRDAYCAVNWNRTA
jgi:hypothetical protein